MKKVKKSTAKKRTVSRSTSRSSSKGPLVFYRRIFVLGSLAVVLAVIVAIPNQSRLRGAVEGASIQFGQYDQQTVTLPSVPNAVSYNIYYKLSTETNYTNAVRNLPINVHSYTVSYLKKNETYVYKISAKNSNGKEIFWAPEQSFVASQSM